VTPYCTDKTHVIKSEAVKALDKEYSGLISEFVELNEFAGKPVRLHNQIISRVRRFNLCVSANDARGAAQGTSAIARVGGKARLVGVVGLGPADKAKVVPKWGASPFQVCVRDNSKLDSPRHPNNSTNCEGSSDSDAAMSM